MFTFHGTGGDEHQFLDLAANLFPQANIISPRGDVSEYGAARFFRRIGEGVYDMADLAKRTHAMTGFVSAHQARTGAKRVIGLGYSNGANILASMLFQTDQLFTDAILMHPLIPFAPPANAGLAGTHVLITAGTMDPICPAPQTQSLAAYLTAQKAEVTLAWQNSGHEIRPAEIKAIDDWLHKTG